MKALLKITTILLVGLMLSCTQKVDRKAEITAAEAVLADYNQAISSKNIDVIAKVFAHNDNIVVVGTSKLPPTVTQKEFCSGWECTRRMFQFMFNTYEQIHFSVRDQKVALSPSGDAAVFSRIEKYDVVLQGNRMVVDSIRSTGALQKQNNKWLLVQVHCSVAGR